MGGVRRAARLFAVPVLLSIVMSACTDTDSTPMREAAPVATTQSPPPASHVQVSAHPDDDILFMNPDLAAGIRAGQATTGIYLTGGESSMPNPEQYVAQRQEGTRAAYAHMAGVANAWEKTRISVADGRLVEVDRLKGRPDVRVVFLNLPEDQDGAAAGGVHALMRLWGERNNAPAVNTLVPDGAEVRTPYSYNHTAIVRTLGALFERFRPTTIKLQDSQPDARYEPQWVGFHNHPDHVVGAKFAREAAGRYMDRTGMPATVLDYRDYNSADAPVNLADSDRADKRAHFARYVEHDSEANLGGAYQDWISHSYYRWPRGTQWTRSDGHGRQHAFAVQGGRITHWTRDPDGRWRPPEQLRTPGPIRPALRVARDHEGRLALFAQSWDGTRVLVKHQDRSGKWPRDWQDLGNPERAQPGRDATQVGTPSVAVDRNGHFVVVLKNAEGGISTLRQTGDPAREWPQTWRNLGGSDVQDNPSAVVGGDGRLQVFAAERDRVVRWGEEQPGAALSAVSRRFGSVRPAGAPRAVRMVDGGVRVVVRKAGDGEIAVFDAAGSSPPKRIEQLANPGGITTPAAVPGGDPTRPRLALIARDSNGNARVARQRPEQQSSEQQSSEQQGSGQREWVDAGGRILDHPTPLIERDGRMTLFAVGVNGELMANRQNPDGTSFNGWHPAASAPRPLPGAQSRPRARADSAHPGANGAAAEPPGR